MCMGWRNKTVVLLWNPLTWLETACMFVWNYQVGVKRSNSLLLIWFIRQLLFNLVLNIAYISGTKFIVAEIPGKNIDTIRWPWSKL